MGAWHFLVLSVGKPHAHKIPPFRGGFWVFLEGGGWKCQFYFYGRGDFSEFEHHHLKGTTLSEGISLPGALHRALVGVSEVAPRDSSKVFCSDPSQKGKSAIKSK